MTDEGCCPAEYPKVSDRLNNAAGLAIWLEQCEAQGCPLNPVMHTKDRDAWCDGVRLAVAAGHVDAVLAEPGGDEGIFYAVLLKSHGWS